MTRFFTFLIIILSATAVTAAPPKTLAGLWYATHGDVACWMRLKVAGAEEVQLIQDVAGELVTRASGRGAVSSSETIEVTGQYMPGSRTVSLNFGDTGVNRLYGAGIAPENRSGEMILQLFRIRPGSGINYERTLYFQYKGPLHDDPSSGSSAAPNAGAGR